MGAAINANPTIHLSLLGRPASIEAPADVDDADPLVMAHLASLWRRCQGEGATDGEIIPAPAEVWSPDPMSARFALSQLTQDVTRVAIHGGIGRFLMLHAAALAHPDTGESLVFVAKGGTGKTTLARNLGRRYAYVTDETVAIDPEGRLVPYPKPLSIRDNAGGKIETSPDELGLLQVKAPPRLAGLILLDRRADSDDPVEVTSLDLFDAIPALVPESSSLAGLDRPLHLLADLIGANGDVQRWTYGDHTDLSDLVAERLGRP